MNRLTYILLFMTCLEGYAQKPWTVDRCMQYAVAHNHEVRLQDIALDDYKAEKVRVIGSFLPAAEGSIGGQYNFGRAIDPETNTYTNVSTFYNSYGLNAGIPVFDGFQRYNNLRAAKANVLMGKSQLMAQKDATAQKVLETYVMALYYKGCIDLATQKRAESEMLLRQTKVMAEVGQKGEADVAQMQATYATDDFEVTHQHSLYENAMLSLKQLMNYPIDGALEIAEYSEETLELADTEEADVFGKARLSNPEIKQAEYSLQSAKYAYRSSKGALYPSISLGAGISTTYYKQLNVPNVTSFDEQFRNNAGRYVFASLSIPIFNRLSTLANIRRQRNNVKRAEEELAYRNSELQRLIQEAIADQENSRKETEKMTAKVKSDSLATHLTIRKYEEGLASSIDVQTQTVTLLQSKVQLLQCQLTYIYKTRMLNYYKGTPLIEY
ncbi:MAG: TolC family protein [Bacteroidales bacterium]|nr:TolC family protein [Bacteroidales bacterium]